MPLRLIVLLVLALAFFLYIMYLNADPVRVTLYPGVAYEASISIFAVGAYSLGVISVFLLYFVDTLAQTVESMREAAAGRRMERARILYEEGKEKLIIQNRREAERLFNKALALSPDSLPPLIALGDMKREDGDIAEAIRLHSRARAVDPQSASAGLSLAEDFIKQNALGPALSALNDVRQIGGRSLPPLARMRDIYAGVGAYSDALEIQKEIVSLADKNQAESERSLLAYFHMKIADGHLSKNLFDEAVDGFYAAIRSDEACDPARVRLAATLDKIGKTGEAISMLRKGFKTTLSPFVLKTLVSLLLKSGDFKAAEKEIRQAMETTPEEPALGLLLAYVHIREGDYPSARVELEKAGEDLSGSTLYHLTAARIRHGENNIDWALTALDKAYEKAAESMISRVCQSCGRVDTSVDAGEPKSPAA